MENPVHIRLAIYRTEQKAILHDSMVKDKHTHTDQTAETKQTYYPLNIGKKKQDLPITIRKKTWQPHEKGTFIK